MRTASGQSALLVRRDHLRVQISLLLDCERPGRNHLDARQHELADATRDRRRLARTHKSVLFPGPGRLDRFQTTGRADLGN